MLVQVQHEVVHKIEVVTDDDEQELVGELSFFGEVLDLLGVVVVALATDALDLRNLFSASRYHKRLGQ